MGSSVSVIMPCFNHGRYLRESVAGVLSQSHENLELIIIDDCSSDNSWEIITAIALVDERIRPIRHGRNLGVSRSRNDGLRAARGEYIAFCDADDVWDRKKLRTQVALLERYTDHDVAYCDARIIDEDGWATGRRFSDLYPPPPQASGLLFEDLLRRNFINTQGVVMRRWCLGVGFFDEDLRVVEDWWYWLRLSHTHRMLYSPEVLASYRVHSTSTSAARRRAYPVCRLKVSRRLLKRYELTRVQRAAVIYAMAADLCELGKVRFARRFLRASAALGISDIRGWATVCRAARKTVMTYRATLERLSTASARSASRRHSAPPALRP